jgi:hypothetical protein
MQTRIVTGAMLLAAAVSLAACTTRPVVVNTPGPGAATIPVPVPATPDISLTNAVEASLQSTLGTDAAGVSVRVEDGTVYLTGHVATTTLRDQAIAAARGTSGVKAVVATGLAAG